MKRDMICIVCPMGCPLTVELDGNGGFVSVSGNTCKRGAVYAESEVNHPTRTITTTVRVANRKNCVLPVKTSCPISKEKMFRAMELINEVQVNAPVAVGDVLIKDLCGECDLVATADRK